MKYAGDNVAIISYVELDVNQVKQWRIFHFIQCVKKYWLPNYFRKQSTSVGSANITKGGIGYKTMEIALNAPTTLFMEFQLKIYGYWLPENCILNVVSYRSLYHQIPIADGVSISFSL